MKKLLLRILVIYCLVNIVAGALFLILGGAQMLPVHTTPKIAPPFSIEKDIAFFRSVVLENESDITDEQKKRFMDIISHYEKIETVDGLSLMTSQALAVFNNAHTTLLSPKMRRLPVRLHWTSDALIVVKAHPDYEYLVGHQVVKIGNKTPEGLLNEVGKVVGGGTAAWKRYRSEYYYTSPSALRLFGVDVNNYTLSIEFESPEKERSVIKMSAQEKMMPSDPFWDFLHLFPDDDSFNTENWKTLLTNSPSLPLYLQQTEQLHAIFNLPDLHSIYVRMNASFDDKKLTIDELITKSIGMMQTETSKNIIVDFRFNRGGNYTTVLPLVETLSKLVPKQGKLYLIVGTNTFSAGIIASSQFKYYVPDKLIVVGSEMGDGLRFKAEGFYPELPYSGIKLYLTKGWTDLIDKCGWLDDCWLPNKFLLNEIGALNINIHAENDWKAILNNKDNIMDAIALDINQRNSGHPDAIREADTEEAKRTNATPK